MLSGARSQKLEVWSWEMTLWWGESPRSSVQLIFVKGQSEPYLTGYFCIRVCYRHGVQAKTKTASLEGKFHTNGNY